MENPKISIIVPIYNTERYLQQCIDSILSQSYKDFELILVDDGSTDGSYEIEKGAEKYDKRVNVVKSNSFNVSEARNFGLKHAKGEYVLFIDSDDYLIEGGLDILFQCSQRFPEADFVQGAFEVITNEKNIGRSKRFDKLDKYNCILLTGVEYLEKLSFIVTYPWNSLIKTSFLFDRDVKFRKELSCQEDLTFLIDIFNKEARGVLTTSATYVYRYARAGSLSNGGGCHITDGLSRVHESLICNSEILQEISNQNRNSGKHNFAEMIDIQICHNLTGVIGGIVKCNNKSAWKEFKKRVKRIPVVGSYSRMILAMMYNINPTLAFFMRKQIR